MKNCTDQDILKKHAESSERQGNRIGAFRRFRSQFDEYQRARKGRKVSPRPVCRPYVEAFRQPHKRGN